MSNKLPRGKCRYCGKSVALRKDGKLRRHLRTSAEIRMGWETADVCGGSGQYAS
jgi:ubiquinone/menaquinone biosynthesis C-methylase UbiE